MIDKRYALTPDYDISRVINGGWQLSAGHALQTPLDMEDAARAFNDLADAGFDTFDGADIYTGVEEFYGSIIAERRSRGKKLPKIHTKFVPDYDALADVDYAYVERIIARSLKRLGVERLDLVQYHWWNYETPGMVDVAGHLERLREKGLIHNIATTNFNAVQLKKLLDAGIPVVSNQCQYSLLDRRPEKRLAGLCRERGVKLICYGSLAGGFLSEAWIGRPKPEHPENRSLVKYLLVIEDSLRWEGYQQLLGLLRDIARMRGMSLSNVASLYVLHKPEAAAVVIGTRNSRHIAANKRLFERDLEPEDIQKLDTFLARFPTVDGDCFDLERLDGSKHRDIMRMNLVES